MKILSVKSMIIKEFRQIFRDKRMRGMIFISPVIMLILFGYAVNMDVSDINIAVLDDDKSPLSRSLVQSVISSKHFILSNEVNSSADGENLLNRGEIELFIEIPERFGADFKLRRFPALQILIDGTDSNRGMIISSQIQTVITEFSSSKSSLRIPLKLEERIFFNEDLESRNYFLPCLLALLIGLITIMLTSMSIVKEREDGTMDQIIVSPLTPNEYITGKIAPYALIAFADMLIITGVIFFWFDVPFRGSLLFLFISGVIFTLSNISVGIFISSVSSTQQQSMLSTFLFFIPSIMLSGFMFPVKSMPEIIQIVTLLNPMRHFMEVVRNIFLKGGGVDVLWRNLLFMMIIGIVLYTVSSSRMRKGME